MTDKYDVLIERLREQAGHTSVEVWTGDLMCEAADALAKLQDGNEALYNERHLFVQQSAKLRERVNELHYGHAELLGKNASAESEIAKLRETCCCLQDDNTKLREALREAYQRGREDAVRDMLSCDFDASTNDYIRTFARARGIEVEND